MTTEQTISLIGCAVCACIFGLAVGWMTAWHQMARLRRRAWEARAWKR